MNAVVRVVFKLADLLRLPRLFEVVWALLVRRSRLTEHEISTASAVLGDEAIRYGAVRIAQGGILRLAFRLNRGRAFTTFHTINLPLTGAHTRSDLSLLVHELVHVYQFETVGSVYIPEALRAQRTEGYSYGGWEGLVKKREAGSPYGAFNREQQAQIAQDYLRYVIDTPRPETDPVRQAYEHFIPELQNGDL